MGEEYVRPVRGKEYVRGSRADGGERRRCCEGGLCERWWWGRGLWWRKVWDVDVDGMLMLMLMGCWEMKTTSCFLRDPHHIPYVSALRI